MTLGEALTNAEATLSGAGVEDPRLEAEALLAHVLGTGRAGVYARLGDTPGTRQTDAFLALAGRRARREPLQYIIGREEFCGLVFRVTPAVLIPRPETELLVEEGFKFLAPLSRRGMGGGEGYPLIADLGTGSGCIAVSLAARLPGATVYAVDRSAAALAVARENARTHGVEGRVTFIEGDLFGPLEAEGHGGRLDLVVSNPPYIPSGEMPDLQPEVLFEPVSALDGGPDGLDVVRGIINEAPAFLRPGGTLLVEIGFGQAEAARGLVEAQPGLQFEKFIKDHAGIERVLMARC